jgi:hypothetical protein
VEGGKKGELDVVPLAGVEKRRGFKNLKDLGTIGDSIGDSPSQEPHLVAHLSKWQL